MRKRKKNPAAVSLGSLGGKSRMRGMTDKQKSELGKLAVEAREAKGRAKVLQDLVYWLGRVVIGVSICPPLGSLAPKRKSRRPLRGLRLVAAVQNC